jgi:transposase
VIAPFAEARDRLDTITGVGKRAAKCILAEIGADMSRFPSAAHLDVAEVGRQLRQSGLDVGAHRDTSGTVMTTV